MCTRDVSVVAGRAGRAGGRSLEQDPPLEFVAPRESLKLNGVTKPIACILPLVGVERRQHRRLRCQSTAEWWE